MQDALADGAHPVQPPCWLHVACDVCLSLLLACLHAGRSLHHLRTQKPLQTPPNPERKACADLRAHVDSEQANVQALTKDLEELRSDKVRHVLFALIWSVLI